MIPELACKNFGKFRKGLIYFALKFKISFEDAEEIVNDSILKALNYYDPDRGSFEALCRVILKHRILNFKKKFKEIIIIGLLDDEDLFKEFYKNHKDIEELEYYNKQCIDILKELMLQLNKEENEFLNRVYEISGNGKKVSISKAAKDLNMSPQEGWNLFRRIQRKAKKYFEESEEFTHKREYLALEDMDASNLFTTQFRMVKVSEKLLKSYNYSLRLKADYLYDKIEQSRLSFIASLTEKQQKLLNSLYG